MSTMVRRLGSACAALALFTMLPLPANAAPVDTARATASVAGSFVTGEAPGEVEKPPPPSNSTFNPPEWRYHITASCASKSEPIRRGAAYWTGGTETPNSGTPVECVSGYVQGCGRSDGGGVVGCNWGAGQRIVLSTMVQDFALLAAHEFGHNWHGHSGQGCASWASQQMVMRTNMC